MLLASSRVNHTPQTFPTVRKTNSHFRSLIGDIYQTNLNQEHTCMCKRNIRDIEEEIEDMEKEFGNTLFQPQHRLKRTFGESEDISTTIETGTKKFRGDHSIEVIEDDFRIPIRAEDESKLGGKWIAIVTAIEKLSNGNKMSAEEYMTCYSDIYKVRNDKELRNDKNSLEELDELYNLTEKIFAHYISWKVLPF